MNKDMIYITFIVPAYNVGDYIADTLESILNQSYKKFHIIIVEDGSTDGVTLRICQEYADKYKNSITLIKQRNLGVGAARNNGLNQVKNSKYVCFLDSDDFLDLFFIENFYKKEQQYKEQNIDVIFGLPNIYNNVSKNYLKWYDEEIFKNIFKKSSYVLPVLEPRLYDLEVNACRKIYSLEFLRTSGFSFEDSVRYEDFLPHFFLLNNAKNCLGFKFTIFNYRINRPNQLTLKSDKSRLDMIVAFKQTIQYMNKHIENKIHRTKIINQILIFSMWTISIAEININKEFVVQLKDVLNLLKKTDISSYKKEIATRTQKLFLFAIKRKYLHKYIVDYIYFDLLKKKIFRR